MKTIMHPDLKSATRLTPLQMNMIHFGGSHTPLVPGQLAGADGTVGGVVGSQAEGAESAESVKGSAQSVSSSIAAALSSVVNSGNLVGQPAAAKHPEEGVEE